MSCTPISPGAGLKLAAPGSEQRLREYRESAYLARQLTRITCDMELGLACKGSQAPPADEVPWWSLRRTSFRTVSAPGRETAWRSFRRLILSYGAPAR